jgi:hypothetical protein
MSSAGRREITRQHADDHVWPFVECTVRRSQMPIRPDRAARSRSDEADALRLVVVGLSTRRNRLHAEHVEQIPRDLPASAAAVDRHQSDSRHCPRGEVRERSPALERRSWLAG